MQPQLNSPELLKKNVFKMSLKKHPVMRQIVQFVLAITLVLLLMILSACQTRYVPVYLSRNEAWVLMDEACRGLGVIPISEADYRSNKLLRDYVKAMDDKWVAFGCPEGL